MTSTFWRRTYVAAVSKAVFSCSLLLSFVLALCQDYQKLDAKVQGATSLEEAANFIRQNPGLDATQLIGELDAILDSERESSEKLKKLRAAVHARALTESQTSERAKLRNPQKDAQKILQSPEYYDAGTSESSNWLSKSLNRLGDALSKLFREPKVKGPDTPNLEVGRWLYYVVWALLVGVVLFLLILVIRAFRFSWVRKRKVGGLLEENEPERTADEWLARADELEREGHFREAVRCLYLACLMKFDDYGVARFVRSQTNWEHLARIARSPGLPQGFEFERSTRSFDRIWYGFAVQGPSDVAMFRDTYRSLCSALEGTKAA